MRAIPKKKDRELTVKQLDVLKLLFRFRFGTADLIAQAQGGVSLQSVQTRLNSMLKSDLIIQKREGKDKLQGKPAIYRLSAKGRRVLRDLDSVKYSEKVLNAIRGNRNTGDQFIDRQLAIFRVHNVLDHYYGEDLVYLTKSNLAAEKFNYMPEVKPDALISLTDTDTSFFMYLIDQSMPEFASVRRVAPVFEYEKIGKWETETGEDLPGLLFACGSNRLETVMRKRIGKMASDNQSDFTIASTTLERLLDSETAPTWRLLNDDDSRELKEL